MPATTPDRRPSSYLAVHQWCGGDPLDLPFGLCCYVAWGNVHVLFTGEVMMPGELQNAAHKLWGFVARDPTTDHGISIEEMLADLDRSGSPGDPSLRPVSWRRVADLDLDATVAAHRCAMTSVRLPMLDGQWDFSDSPLRLGIQGTGPHALTVVAADADRVVFVTWGELQTVSRGWWDAYVTGTFEVVHP